MKLEKVFRKQLRKTPDFINKLQLKVDTLGWLDFTGPALQEGDQNTTEKAKQPSMLSQTTSSRPPTINWEVNHNGTSSDGPDKEKVSRENTHDEVMLDTKFMYKGKTLNRYLAPQKIAGARIKGWLISNHTPCMLY